ncbi:hypothetical protein HG536_0D05370 [Torulaspora globosa]|uniref:Lipid droplet-associated hydrolase n=1 Tax=Torulaspora globosa TaxID=48254 RepID=A0A7G3ZHM9_9SACH|nr:uncharacterized protein HG536_0D05370 [Torulaspora globosa]QLL33015.1 hypothetical protein HG536_0D05370 [Torulaspora globosa]
MAIRAYLKSTYPTSIIHLKSINLRARAECPLFVWIPGNPGLMEYYEEFLMLVHRHRPDWEVLGISHAGFNTVEPVEERRKDGNVVFSLEQQIDHKLEIIREFSSPNRPLIIMGHSVGAYMVQKIAMSEKLVGKVIRTGLLTPTILDIHTSERGRLLSRAFYWLRSLPTLAGWGSSLLFDCFLPSLVTKTLLSIAMGCGLKSSPVLATEKLVKNSKFIKQALGLAAFEMQEIRTDWEFQRDFINHCNKNKISTWLLFSNSDHWVAESTREDLIRFYDQNYDQDRVTIHVCDIPHSFVLKHSKYLVDNFFVES